MKESKRLWYGLLVGIVIFGIVLRFYNLDGKVYWHDEIYTSFRAAGHGSDNAGDFHQESGMFPIGKLQLFQQLSPERGWDKTWASLRTHPEHPPLYYLGVRLAMTWFGSSPTTTRGLAAAISLLAFPGLYWLCRELFDRPLVAEIAIALFAVSPFQVLYAQEARQYSLWTVAVLFSSAVFLWARRTQTRWSWGIYGATAAVGMYTVLLFPMTIIAHGIYLAIVDRWRRSSRYFLIAIAFAIASFTPWLGAFAEYWQKFREQTAWIEMSVDPARRIQLWGLHVSSSFIDLGLPLEHPYTYTVPPLCLLLVSLGVWVLYRHCAATAGNRTGEPPRAWLFVGLGIAVNIALLVLPDLLFGGKRSMQSRYFVPAYIGWQILAAYLISALTSRSLPSRSAIAEPVPDLNSGVPINWLTSPRSRQFGQGLFALLLACGAISCTFIVRADVWWNKGSGYWFPQIVREIRAADRPLLLIPNNGAAFGEAIALSHLLPPETPIQFVGNAIDTNFPDTVCEIFVFRASTELRARAQTDPELGIVHVKGDLWRLFSREHRCRSTTGDR